MTAVEAALPVASAKARILFFCPEGQILPHLMSTALAARVMQSRGHDVALVACLDLFDRCIPKAATSRVDWPRAEQLALCAACSANVVRAAKMYGLPALRLPDYVTPELRRWATETIDTAKDRLGFVHDDEHIGWMAASLYILRFKSAPGPDDPPERQEWFRQHLVTTLVTYAALKTLLTASDISHVVVFNSYPPNLAAMRAAYRCGRDARMLTQPAHRGVDRRFVTVTREEMRMHFLRVGSEWEAWKLKPIQVHEVVEAGADVSARMGASSAHIYSPARSVQADYRKTLGLPADRRLVVVYTSSPDEGLANTMILRSMTRPELEFEDIFSDQIAWLEALRDFAARRPDLHFLIRLHPRLDGNRREPIRSPDLDALERNFGTSGPDNWRIFWPGDPVSSYDLMEIADVVLTSWSTIGIEAARLGVPVMAAFHGTGNMPYDAFMEGPSSVADYFARIDRMIGAEARLERILEAFRYHVRFCFSAAVSLTDIVPDSQFSGLPPYRTPAEAATLEEALIGDAPLSALRLADPTTDSTEARWNERRALLRVLAAIVQFLFLGRYQFPGMALKVSELKDTAHPAACPPGTAIVAAQGNVCTFRSGDTHVERYSALTARLIRLLARERMT
jgi:hypothetical protein